MINRQKETIEYYDVFTTFFLIRITIETPRLNLLNYFLDIYHRQWTFNCVPILSWLERTRFSTMWKIIFLTVMYVLNSVWAAAFLSSFHIYFQVYLKLSSIVSSYAKLQMDGECVLWVEETVELKFEKVELPWVKIYERKFCFLWARDRHGIHKLMSIYCHFSSKHSCKHVKFEGHISTPPVLKHYLIILNILFCYKIFVAFQHINT